MEDQVKAIVCGKCADIRALRSSGPVTCECGNVTGWWIDPNRGIARVYATDRSLAKIMGVHNGLVRAAFSAYDFSAQRWQDIHKALCEVADGFLFKDRNCPVVIVAIGMSNDVTWADRPPSQSRSS